MGYPYDAVKAAKKDACRIMHEWFKTHESDIEDHVQKRLGAVTRARAAHRVQAMLGDAVLSLILIMHCPKDLTTTFQDGMSMDVVSEASDNGTTEDIGPPTDIDPGALHDFLRDHANNNFLFSRFLELSREGRLPEGLMAPQGGSQADPTSFEAWIGKVFKESKGRACQPSS